MFFLFMFMRSCVYFSLCVCCVLVFVAVVQHISSTEVCVRFPSSPPGGAQCLLSSVWVCGLCPTSSHPTSLFTLTTWPPGLTSWAATWLVGEGRGLNKGTKVGNIGKNKPDLLRWMSSWGIWVTWEESSEWVSRLSGGAVLLATPGAFSTPGHLQPRQGRRGQDRVARGGRGGQDGGHLPLDQGGQHHPSADVARRHRTWHEPRVSSSSHIQSDKKPLLCGVVNKPAMNNHIEIHQVDRLDESRKGCNYVTNLQTHTHTPAKVFASKVLRLGSELWKLPDPKGFQ